MFASTAFFLDPEKDTCQRKALDYKFAKMIKLDMQLLFLFIAITVTMLCHKLLNQELKLNVLIQSKRRRNLTRRQC